MLIDYETPHTSHLDVVGGTCVLHIEMAEDSVRPPRCQPRMPERLESWCLPLSYDDVQRVRKLYSETGFEEAFAFATQLKVSIK